MGLSSSKEWPVNRLFVSVIVLIMLFASGGAFGQESESFINFSFDQVDVSAFVKLVGDITGKKFVVSDDVKGKVTIVSPRVSRKEVFPLFVTILESSSCSVVQDGEMYRVVSLPDRKSRLGDVVGVNEQTPAQGIITKIIHVANVPAVELRKILESGVGGGKEGAIGALEDTNHLIITDTADNIRRIEKIIAEVDKPGLARSTEVIFLQYANASDLAEQLNEALYEGETRGNRLQRSLPRVSNLSGSPQSSASDNKRTATVVASPDSNSLILVGTPSQNDNLREVIRQLDVDSPSGRGNLNAIFLKYIKADDAAKNISELLTQLDKKARTEDRRQIAVAASVENNAIIVDAMPGDFEMVKKLIEQLDKIPEQVHISVVIAELSVGSGLDIGVDMAALDMPGDVGSTVVQGSSKLSEGVDSLMTSIQKGIFPSGISAGIAYGSSKDASGNVVASYPGMISINAIKKNSRFNVLSETSLEAQNNKEASVSIVNEIPITKSTISGAGDARDVIQNIDRIEVGIKLKLTPHIIPGGEVQMVLNPSIEAVIDPGPSGTQFAPTIARREVSTTVTVGDGRTIVIAGLTRADKTKVVRKVPILGSIPLIGWLFRHTTDEENKTNLLIFVTPYIVTNDEDAGKIMNAWQEKTGLNKDEGQ